MDTPKAYYGECKCCLNKTFLKNMWEPLETKGEWEVYGQMLVDCFGIDWTIQEVEDDNMCQVCISKLRVCVAFRKQVLESQATRLQGVQVVSSVQDVASNETDQVDIEITSKKDDNITTSQCTPIKEVQKSIPTKTPIEKVETRLIPTIASLENAVTKPISTKTYLNNAETRSIPTSIKNIETKSIPTTTSMKTEETRSIPTMPSLKNAHTKFIPTITSMKNLVTKSMPTKILSRNEENVSIPTKTNHKNEEYSLTPSKTSLKEVDTSPVKPIKEESDDFKLTINEDVTDNEIEFVNMEVNDDKNYEDVEFLEEGILEEEILEEQILEEEFEKNEDDDKDEDSEPVKKKFKRAKRRHPSKKIKPYRQYTEETVMKAIEAVKTKKMSRNKAAQVYKIPRKTLTYKMNSLKNNKNKEPEHARQMKNGFRAVLMHTNATPFKLRNRKGFFCFFCPLNSEELTLDDLRLHTQSEHGDKIEKASTHLHPCYLNQMVRFDVAGLACVCKEEVNWQGLFGHLRNKHGVTDVDEAERKFVPYLLGTGVDNICPLCKFTGSFPILDNHMNSHYPNFICGDCGKAFVTLRRLQAHAVYHKFAACACDKCNIVFTNINSRKIHMDRVHNGKLIFKCLVCPKRFFTDQMKLNHMRNEHNDLVDTLGHRCKLCNVSFWRRDYWRHMSRTHKRFLCAKCGRYFEKQRFLDEHLCRAVTKRTFKCDLCSKLFYTSKAVEDHKKRGRACIDAMNERKKKLILNSKRKKLSKNNFDHEY